MPASDFSISVLPSKEAHLKLRHLRSGRGGRTSKFQPVLERVMEAKEGEIVVVEGVEKNQVQTLRAFVYRHLDPEVWSVKSAKQKDSDQYTVAIGRAEDFA